MLLIELSRHRPYPSFKPEPDIVALPLPRITLVPRALPRDR